MEVRNLSKKFGKKQVISDFSETFPDTGVVRITGPSGVGKTTLLRLLAGLEKKDAGEVIGFDRAAFLFQDKRLFPTLSALENVALAGDKSLPKKERFAAARDMLTAVGIGDADMSLTPDKLSGGMQQRVAIARTLLLPSDVLLLDEPTKELDRENREIVTSLFLARAKTSLLIYVSHEEGGLGANNETVITL